MKHRTSRPLVSMNQGIGRTGGGSGHTKSPGDSLDEGRLACAKISLEREQLSRPELPTQGLAFGIELCLGQRAAHAWRRILPVGRRTSGALAALSSFN